MSQPKTNAMRLLETAGIAYRVHTYEISDGNFDGELVAAKIGQPVERVYKTLVTQGASKAFFVFVIPVSRELDLKAAARAVGEKSVEMIKVADINKVTGYIRGGCSPLGMKKDYRTVFDATCRDLETMIVSAGKIGFQIEVAPMALAGLAHAELADIVMDEP